MAYSFGGRVRYSETGESGYLTLPGILNYFQDCSTFHSESIGAGGRELRERNKFWVLSAWQVVINRYPYLGEEITAATWPYDFRGFMGLRNFTLDTKEGERLACANTFWTFIDGKNGFPCKLKPEDTEGYELEEKLDMDYASRKIALPECFQPGEAFAVQKYHLDTNHHVNNCQYIRMAMEQLPGDFVIRQMRAEYKQQARLHDVICPEWSAEGDKVVVRLNDRESEPYAVVEFLK